MRFFKITVPALALMLLLNGCKKKDADNNAYTVSNGTLTGFDARKCYCCFGVFVNINGVEKVIQQLPGYTLEQMMQISYPKSVRLSWKPSAVCPDEVVEVEWAEF
jgi:hypothetical protein